MLAVNSSGPEQVSELSEHRARMARLGAAAKPWIWSLCPENVHRFCLDCGTEKLTALKDLSV